MQFLFKTQHIDNKKDKTFVGFDISLTSSGIAQIDFNGNLIKSTTVLTDTKMFPEGKYFERVKYIHDTIYEKIDLSNVGIICIEDYHVAHISSARGLIEVGFPLRYKLYYDHIGFFTVQATQVKKFVTGSGKGEKEVVMKDLYKNFGFDTNSNDEADAIGMALIARAIYYLTNNMEIELKKYQLETIQTIIKDRPFYNYDTKRSN